MPRLLLPALALSTFTACLGAQQNAASALKETPGNTGTADASAVSYRHFVAHQVLKRAESTVQFCYATVVSRREVEAQQTQHLALRIFGRNASDATWALWFDGKHDEGSARGVTWSTRQEGSESCSPLEALETASGDPDIADPCYVDLETSPADAVSNTDESAAASEITRIPFSVEHSFPSGETVAINGFGGVAELTKASATTALVPTSLGCDEASAQTVP